MKAIDLNKAEEFGATDVQIFNDGITGIVEGVNIRIELKGPQDVENAPDYKLYAKDKIGEVNEGFYYQDSEENPGWKSYQAQRLIRLARGVLGDDFVFPEYDTPKDALDGVMKLIVPAIKGISFRVAVTYGTIKRPSQYLGFKSFGRFIENMELMPESKLILDDRFDQFERPIPKSEEDIKEELYVNNEEGDSPSWLSDDN